MGIFPSYSYSTVDTQGDHKEQVNVINKNEIKGNYNDIRGI